MHVANVIDAVLDDGEVVMPALARQRLHRSLAIVHGRVTERCERRWWRSTFEGIDGHAFRGREERCDADRSTPDLDDARAPVDQTLQAESPQPQHELLGPPAIPVQLRCGAISDASGERRPIAPFVLLGALPAA